MDKKERWESLKKDLESHAGKMPLINKPEDVIFGEGNLDAQIMLIGEAGGYWEAKLRRPFVGNAGKLLDELIRSLDLRRDEVYISNVVKARPPENRDPLPEEIKSFKPYLEKEIAIIEPKVIITLGRFAMNYFLPLGKISRDHGKGRLIVIEYNERHLILIPMFHPAAALRSREVEQKLREDFKKIPAEIKRITEPPKPVGGSISSIATQPEEKREEQLSLI